MFLHVEKAKYVKDHILWIQFNDGTSGKVDLSTELEGPIFDPLRDPQNFKNFSLCCHTVSWDNGADFAPEFLREKLQT